MRRNCRATIGSICIERFFALWRVEEHKLNRTRLLVNEFLTFLIYYCGGSAIVIVELLTTHRGGNDSVVFGKFTAITVIRDYYALLAGVARVEGSTTAHVRLTGEIINQRQRRPSPCVKVTQSLKIAFVFCDVYYYLVNYKNDFKP